MRLKPRMFVFISRNYRVIVNTIVVGMLGIPQEWLPLILIYEVRLFFFFFLICIPKCVNQIYICNIYTHIMFLFYEYYCYEIWDIVRETMEQGGWNAAAFGWNKQTLLASLLYSTVEWKIVFFGLDNHIIPYEPPLCTYVSNK